MNICILNWCLSLGGIKSQFISLFFSSLYQYINSPYKLLHFLVKLSGKKEWLVCEKWANFSAFLFTLALATEIWLVVLFFNCHPLVWQKHFFSFCKDRNKNFKVRLCTRSCFWQEKFCVFLVQLANASSNHIKRLY